MRLTSGSITFNYIGLHGAHTVIEREGKVIARLFGVNTSALFMLWVTCDITNIKVEQALLRLDSVTSHNTLLQEDELFSYNNKYDILINPRAAAEWYKVIYDKHWPDPVPIALSQLLWTEETIRLTYNLSRAKTRVRYELDEASIYSSQDTD